MPRAALTLWCIIHSNDKGDSRVWVEEYGASAIGARLYAATAGFKLEDGETAQTFEIAPTAARKLPKDMIGRVLHGAEFERLMKIIANDDRGRSRPRKHFRP
jgi:hypothetical protein